MSIYPPLTVDLCIYMFMFFVFFFLSATRWTAKSNEIEDPNLSTGVTTNVLVEIDITGCRTPKHNPCKL